MPDLTRPSLHQIEREISLSIARYGIALSFQASRECPIQHGHHCIESNGKSPSFSLVQLRSATVDGGLVFAQ
jgi:hypothetical protein